MSDEQTTTQTQTQTTEPTRSSQQGQMQSTAQDGDQKVTTQGGDQKVTMTAAELEAFVRGRVDAAIAIHAKKHPLPPDVASELEELRRFRQDREREALEAKGKYEEALKAQEESIRKPYEQKLSQVQEEAKTLRERLHREVVTAKLLAGAAPWAYNAEQVVALTERYVKLDDQFNPTVVDDSGTQRFLNGKPMEIGDLLEEFKRANPHLVKASGVGSTAGGAKGGASTTGSVDLSELQALEAQAKELEQQYRRTRSVDVLTKHRQLSAKIRELKSQRAA